MKYTAHQKVTTYNASKGGLCGASSVIFGKKNRIEQQR